LTGFSIFGLLGHFENVAFEHKKRNKFKPQAIAEDTYLDISPVIFSIMLNQNFLHSWRDNLDIMSVD
jgi:hypothetical protein